MNTLTKKSIIATAVIAVSYVLALFLPAYFTFIAVVQVISIIALWFYFFDVKPNRETIYEKSKFLVLPIIFNFGSLYLTTLFFQIGLEAFIAILAIVANYYLWSSLRKVHNLSERAALLSRNILIVISFLSVFVGSTALFRAYMLLSTSSSRGFFQFLLVLLEFSLFYVVSYFLSWENSSDENLPKLKPYNFAISLLGAEIAWVSSLWIVNYPVISVQEKASLGGTPLPAILLTIVFYFLWGIIFHKLDRSLTRRVLTEYILLASMFILVLLITARWLPNL